MLGGDECRFARSGDVDLELDRCGRRRDDPDGNSDRRDVDGFRYGSKTTICDGR